MFNRTWSTNARIEPSYLHGIIGLDQTSRYSSTNGAAVNEGNRLTEAGLQALLSSEIGILIAQHLSSQNADYFIVHCTNLHRAKVPDVLLPAPTVTGVIAE